MKIGKIFMVGMLTTILRSAAFGLCPEPESRVCSEFTNANSIIIGKVLSDREYGDSEAHEYKTQVVKTLWGEEKKEIDWFVQNDSGRPNFEIKVGSSYLLFLNEQSSLDKGGWHYQYWTASCGNSCPLADSDNVIAQLNESILQHGKNAGGSIRGRVVDSLHISKEIAGIKFLIAGGWADVKRQLEVVSDKDGWFSAKLPAGSYDIYPDSCDWHIHEIEIYGSYQGPYFVHFENGGGADVYFSAIRKGNKKVSFLK